MMPTTLPARFPDDHRFTTHELANLLQVDAATVGKWIDRKWLIGYRTPGGHRRIMARHVRELAQRVGMWLPPELV